MRYMAYLSWFVILPLLTAIDGGTRRSLEVSNRTARVTTKVSRRETPTLPPPYLRLPVFVDSSLPLVEREHFSPAVRGAGHEPVPEAVREILIPAERPSTGPPDVTGVLVRTSCKMNKMLVQVERSMLGTGEAHPALRLGTCQASNSTGDYLYFQYDFGKCGTKRTIVDDQVAYSNTLQYDPPKLQGPIRRAVPFTLSVASKFILTPRNAQWERLSPSDQYVLGKPMYFEAEAPSMSQDKRLYVHSCYVTREKSHTSTLQFPLFFIVFLRWVELYGSVSVCTCCDSSCSSAASTGQIPILKFSIVKLINYFQLCFWNNVS
uniref:Zona pellucida glycoprotein 3d tandem duplicate 2 n=1 Tax=Scophthalmus maximus TaxID=52904 RepID=A0A8D3BC33_SCOMX